jgi:hypothetical protein
MYKASLTPGPDEKNPARFSLLAKCSQIEVIHYERPILTIRASLEVIQKFSNEYNLHGVITLDAGKNDGCTVTDCDIK